MPKIVQGRRPVYEARRQIQPLFGKVITYEEPILSWRDELESAPEGPALMLRNRAFVMPGEAVSGSDAGAALEKMLDAYHQQTQGTRFRVLTSKLGYHIVPAQVRNERGDPVPAASLLDAQIYVAPEDRLPEAHLQALGDAVTAATGIRLGVAPIPLSPNGFDRSFQLRPAAFRWGGEGVTARDALIDLLTRGASTYTWDMMCNTGTRPEDRHCLLTITFLKVAITGPDGKPATEVLRFDRCGECRRPDL